MEILRKHPNCNPYAIAEYFKASNWRVVVRAPLRGELVKIKKGAPIDCVDERTDAQGPAYPGGLHGIVLSQESGTVKSYDETSDKLQALGLTPAIHGDYDLGEFDGCGLYKAVKAGLLRGIIHGLADEVSAIEDWIRAHPQILKINFPDPHNINGLVVNLIEGFTPRRLNRLGYDDWFAEIMGIVLSRRLALVGKVGQLLVPEPNRLVEIIA